MAIVYPEPLPAFRFLVRVGDGKEFSAAFARFSGIRMQVQTFENRFCDDARGVQEHYPVFTKYAPVSLSKGVVGDNEFFDWLLAASAGEHTGPTGKDLRRTLEIVSINEFGQPGVVWVLKDAMPIGYELSPMDSSRSEVLMESITFAIGGMTRKTEQWKPPARPQKRTQ